MLKGFFGSGTSDFTVQKMKTSETTLYESHFACNCLDIEKQAPSALQILQSYAIERLVWSHSNYLFAYTDVS